MQKVVCRSDDGVVDRRSAACLDVVQAFFQLLDVAGEVLVDEGLPRKVDQKGFVLRIREADQIERCLADRGTLVVHGS